MKACELVGVSRRTIYNWLSSGKIEYVRTAGGSARIFVDTLWRDPNGSEQRAAAAASAAACEPQAPPPAAWQARGRNQAPSPPASEPTPPAPRGWRVKA